MNIPGFRLHYKIPQIADASETQKSNTQPAIQKNLPYLHTEKGKDQIGLNCTVPFEGQTDIAEVDRETVACRHFSSVLGLNALTEPDGKIALTAVDSPEHIAASIKKDAQQLYLSILANSSNVSAFDNDNFADFLKAQFQRMEVQPFAEGDALATHVDATHEAGSGDARTRTKGVKTFLIESTNHAMLLRLRLKEKEGVPVYVVSFYDPNRTACLVRCEVSDLAELGQKAGSHSLAAFINPMVDGQADTNDYKTYFPQDTAEIAIAFEVPSKGDAEPPEMKEAGRKLQSCDCKASPTLMFYLMRYGFPGSIDEIAASFNETGTPFNWEMLEAKDADGTTGLYLALQNNHAEAIGAWGMILARLPPKQQRSVIIANLLEANSMKGNPGIASALLQGHTSALSAWGKLLALLPDNERRSPIIRGLLEAKDMTGIPGLYLALQDGHAEAIKTWGNLLNTLPKDTSAKELAKLIFAVCDDGDTALEALLYAEDEETSSAWQALLSYLPASAANLKTAAITALKSDDLESLVTLRQELNNFLAADTR